MEKRRTSQLYLGCQGSPITSSHLSPVYLSSVSPTRLQLHKGKEHICLVPCGLPSTWHTECSINTWGMNELGLEMASRGIKTGKWLQARAWTALPRECLWEGTSRGPGQTQGKEPQTGKDL